MEKILLIINSSKDGEEKLHKSFLKTLGIKSDSVGWCELDLQDSETKGKLEKISKYAKEKHRSVRVHYKWKEELEECEWYLYEPQDLAVDIRAWKEVKVPSNLHRNGWTYHSVIDGINAYKIPKNVSVVLFSDLKATSAIVSNEFKSCVEANSLTGLEFVWARDKGRYQAPDYYRAIHGSIYNDKQIFISSLSMFSGEKIRKRRHDFYGPNWSWFAEFDFILDGIDIPPIFKGEIPKTDIVVWEWGFILSKRAVKCMLEAKVVAEKELSPCRFVKEVPEYYHSIYEHFERMSSRTIGRLSAEEIDEIEKEHQKFSKKVRPVREVKQKDVLKAMRNQKKEHPDDFSKPLKKSLKESLIGSKYEAILPYLGISDGMCTDEIELLSYEEMQEATADYMKCRAKEELENLPEGVQIAISGGGDYIILTSEKVLRYSHEDWSIENEWKNVDLFMMEVLEEIE